MATERLAESSLRLLDAALKAWQSKGFAYTALPWVVPQKYTQATLPSGSSDVLTPHGAFVGAGEQSFLQLWDEGQLPADDVPGFVGWTPCVRDEPVLDRWHQHTFLKAELFQPLPSGTDLDLKHPRGRHQEALEQLLTRQTLVFRELARQEGMPDVLVERDAQGDLQVDLTLGTLEIGSYGIRRFQSLVYLYGTVLALPRFHQALQSFAEAFR